MPNLQHSAQRRLHVAISALGVFMCTSALAQDRTPPTIPPDIQYVVTGGRWSAAGRTGVYRVLVRTGGFEHVVSEAVVEWVATDKGEAQIIASKLAPTESWRLDNPRILGAGTAWRVELDALETHTTPPTRGRWVVHIGSPGQLSASQASR